MAGTKQVKITHKKGLSNDLPILSMAELGFTTDEHKIYMGTGVDNIEIVRAQDLKVEAQKLVDHEADFLPHDSALSQFTSLPDENGVYRVVEFKRPDGSLYMKSTASNPDVTGNYETFTWEFYENNTVVLTKTWTITYDENNVATTKEMQ